jgi:SH3 domain protein
MPKRLFGCLGLCLFLAAGSAVAETVYVHDYLRLGVRSNPNSSETPIAVVTTGDALEVLERNGGYLKVRAEDGTEGWVSKAYVSSEKPARLQLEQLQQAYGRREAELKELRGELTARIDKGEQQEKQLAELMSENATLHQQVSRLYSRNAELKREYAWLYQGAALIVLFLLGFYLGVRWYKRRITDRLGGLEI